MEPLVEALQHDLRTSKVALGFECPLFVPMHERPSDLTARRSGEAGRPWSAAAGACSMGVGMVQALWLLDRVRRELKPVPPVFFEWTGFANASSGLFVWEAFVSGTAKAAIDAESPHCEDAMVGLLAFKQSLPDPPAVNAIDEEVVMSLAGAALLRTGWTSDARVLRQACLVIRPADTSRKQ